MTIYKKATLTVFSLAILTSSLSGCTGKKHDKSSEVVNDVLKEKFYSSLVIPVTINNKVYHFLVDTGASITVLDEGIAKEITQETSYSTLHPFHKEVFSNFKTVQGKIDVKNLKFLKPVSMFIGDEEISDNEIWISNNLSLLTEAIGTNINGIIGIDTFRKFNWQIDNNNKILTISKNSPPISAYSHCIGYSDNYGQSPWIFLDAENNTFLNMRVDTGNTISSLGKDSIDYFKNQKEKIIPVKHGIPEVEATGLIQSRHYIITGLQFNGYSLGEMRFSENNNQYLLGLNFLSRLNRYSFMPGKMLFCYDANSLYKENQYPVRNIGVRYHNENIEIYYNKQSDIDKYHLKNGDVIIKINDVVYPPKEIEKVRDVLSLTPKGKLIIFIKRLGVNKKIVI